MKIIQKTVITKSKNISMASKVFADANLLLDFTLQRANFADASAIIQHAIDGTIQLFITTAVLYITSYYTSQAYTKEQTKQIILTLLNDVQVIDCDHATVISALNGNIDDTEDALQYYTALKHNIDFLISNDKKLKKAAIPQLPVYTAAELIAELNQ